MLLLSLLGGSVALADPPGGVSGGNGVVWRFDATLVDSGRSWAAVPVSFVWSDSAFGYVGAALGHSYLVVPVVSSGSVTSYQCSRDSGAYSLGNYLPGSGGALEGGEFDDGSTLFLSVGSVDYGVAWASSAFVEWFMWGFVGLMVLHWSFAGAGWAWLWMRYAVGQFGLE